jgi:predicted GNAT family acetyltransferase
VADGLTIRPASTDADIAAVRGLCWAYRDFLLTFGETERRITETFYPQEKYAALMDRLEQEHARPRGIILLAERGGAVVGCGMSHALNDTDAEIKRVYVTDAARGTGAGHRRGAQALPGADRPGAGGRFRAGLPRYLEIAGPGAGALHRARVRAARALPADPGQRA